jgi:hypothetical protein
MRRPLLTLLSSKNGCGDYRKTLSQRTARSHPRKNLFANYFSNLLLVGRQVKQRLATRPKTLRFTASAARLIPENPIPHRTAVAIYFAEALAEVRAMADLKAGDPKTIESDLIAEKEWQNTWSSFGDLVLGRAERRKKISEFEKDQRATGVVSLGDAIEWLAELDEKLLFKRVSKIWKALSESHSAFQIGGELLPSVTIVHEDSTPPIEPFNATDMASARKSKMYTDSRAMRSLLGRLWIPRDVLLGLFKQNDLPSPPSWIEPTTPVKLEKREKPRTGKYLLVAQFLEERFPGVGVPDPAIEPRKRLITDALAALPKLGGKLDEATMDKAIKLHNAKQQST